MLKFKEGQVYEYMGDIDTLFEKGQKLTVKGGGGSYYVVSRSGSRWYEDDFDDRELRLVEEPKCFGLTAKELKDIASKLEDIEYHERQAEYHTNQVKVVKDAIDKILGGK